MGRGSRAPCGCGARALCERGVRGPRYTGALAAARAGGRNSGCGAAPLPGRTPLPFIGCDPTPRVRSLTPSGRGGRSPWAPPPLGPARRTERRGVSSRYRSSIDVSRIKKTHQVIWFQTHLFYQQVCCDRPSWGSRRAPVRPLGTFGVEGSAPSPRRSGMPAVRGAGAGSNPRPVVLGGEWFFACK